MFYVIEVKYIGINPNVHTKNSHVLDIRNEPIKDGAFNDWDGTTHGEYGSLEEARQAVADVAGDAGYRDYCGFWDFAPEGPEGALVERYYVGDMAKATIDSSRVAAITSHEIDEIRADMGATEVEKMAQDYIDAQEQYFGVLECANTIHKAFKAHRDTLREEQEEEIS